jgi:transcriptional regulator with XRE-family HTH domain
VRSRLTQARFAAVAELERGRRSPWQRFLAPAAGVLVTAVLVAIVVAPLIRLPEQLADQPAARLADDDIPILLDTDNIEMLEDMEFYAWLDDDALDDDTAAPATAQPVEPARS